MVNLLVGSKNIDETNIFCNSLANDKEYKIKTANTAISTISTYLNIKPDILILDNSLTDLSIENIINKLSYSPIEEENCNIILTVPKNYNLQLNNIAKINKIVYKPIINNELIIALKNMSDRHNTPCNPL